VSGAGRGWHARPVNVADLVRTAAAEHGDRTAFRTLDGATLTWAEVDARVGEAAATLRAHGAQPGDRVAIALPNSVAFAVAFWGALRAGAVVVPVNPAYTPREQQHIVTDSTPTLLIRSTELLPEAVEADAGRGAADSGWRAPGEPGPLSEAVPRSAPAQPPSNTAVICYTSGTTGAPKGALLTHDNFLSNLRAFAGLDALRLTEDDVPLGLLPFFHIFGLNVILNAAALHGASVLVMDHFSPAGSLKALAEHGVTVAYGAPPVFAAWCAVGEDEAPPLPRLRAAVSGADSLPERVWHGFHHRFGVPIQESYGLTETAPGLTSNAAAPEPRAGTVGMPLPGVEIRLVGPDGAVVGAGQPGEIVARGPNVFGGYHGRPDATAEVLDADGWFRTGDLGEWDADGYLRIIGRLKDMVIVSGFNVYPREVEEVLLEHPGVADAAVVGIPDGRTGERVRAVVVPADGHTLDEAALLAHCRERLARYKLPREVVLVAALPRRTTGKVSRDTLRALDARAPVPG
jgi:long-chain acyl-CoA synthetase